MIQEPAEMPLSYSVSVNTDIWNNRRLSLTTGYTIEMLREPLYHLAEFIKSNLVPNHLQYFQLGNILGVKNVQTINSD